MRYHLKCYLLPRCGNAAVEEITTEAVNEWLGEPELAHVSPKSISGIVRTLQLARGVRFGRKIAYPSSVSEEDETRCYSSAEVGAILAAATGQYKVLFTMVAESGLRAEGLAVEDVDFDRHVMHVRRSMWNGQSQSPRTNNAPHGGRDATLRDNYAPRTSRRTVERAGASIAAPHASA
jgi:hypothetical protein